MDIEAFKAPDMSGVIDVEITVPGSKAKTGLVVQVQSMASDDVRAVSRRHDGRILRQSSARKDLTVDDLDQIAGENLSTRTLDMVCATVTGWVWGDDESGEPFVIGGEVWEYTAENVKRLLSEFPFIRDQIREQAETVANFTKA